MSSRLVFLHALTPLHAGTGQGVGSIDLPIARETATSLPFVPGSTIKGCLRDSLPLSKDEKNAIFGNEVNDSNAFAGALRVADARLTLLPVRSLTATFVWATCPFILRRLERDAVAAGLKGTPPIGSLKRGEAQVSATTELVTVGQEKRLILEELDFKVVAAQGVAQWTEWFAAALFENDNAWRGEFEKRFAIVDDESFTFLSEFATEVNAHIRIGEEGTVEAGALWYQESLPAEAILTSAFQAGPTRNGVNLSAKEILERVRPKSPVQFGGKATTGLGVVQLSFVGASGA